LTLPAEDVKRAAWFLNSRGRQQPAGERRNVKTPERRTMSHVFPAGAGSVE